DPLFGKPVEASRELRVACRALEEVGEQTNYSSVAALLAPALCAQSEFAEAEEFSRASEAAMRTAMRLLRLPRFTRAPGCGAMRPRPFVTPSASTRRKATSSRQRRHTRSSGASSAEPLVPQLGLRPIGLLELEAHAA